ncbi:hypothetical protein AgCh_022891 [Apium graveolens]
MSLRKMERGQTSARRQSVANVILKPKKYSSKHSTKNPLDLVYVTPQQDEKKLLAYLQILENKEVFRVKDTDERQTYIRKKKSRTIGDTQGAHTVPTAVKDSVNAPSQSQIDVALINVESQPKSLLIETPQTQNSPANSLDVDMINRSIPDSPSLTLMEKPKSQASKHHLLNNLLAHLPFLSENTEKSVDNLKSITTDSTVVSTPNSIISSHSMDFFIRRLVIVSRLMCLTTIIR